MDSDEARSLTQSCDSLNDDKALKKARKKERQKAKRNQEKDGATSVPVTVAKEMAQGSNKGSVERRGSSDENDTDVRFTSNDENSRDITFFAEDSAFVQSIINLKDMAKPPKNNITNKFKDDNREFDKISIDGDDGFTTVTKAPITFEKIGFQNGSNDEPVENFIFLHESYTDVPIPTIYDISHDFTFFTKESAFVESIINQKDFSKQQKNDAFGKVKDDNREFDKISMDEDDGFTAVTKGKKQAPIGFYKTPEGYGNEALRVIFQCDFPLAIIYLTKGISLDRTDHRHYINRSYCYLRIGQYKEALNDIRYAIDHLTDITDLSRAKCREGQALAGLQHYEEAEVAFKESINLVPGFLFAQRQLKRTQILRLMYMGFNERDAILALQNHPETRDAIDQLSDQSLTNSGTNDLRGSLSDDDDEIFISDTEDDPSNERLLSKLLNYDPMMPEEPCSVESLPVKEKPHNYGQALQTPSQERPLRIRRALPIVVAKHVGRGLNEMAIWVGNLKPPTTEEMVKKVFSRYGKITSINWKLPNAFAFINFQNPSSTQKALDAARAGEELEINGMKLFVKPATLPTKK